MEKELNGYELSRNWFDFCFENTELISPNHTAMYFFIIEHCNRLGWKEKFGLPMEMTKDAIGIKNYRTFSKTFQDLEQWGFIKVLQKSKNQYSSNIIAIVKNTKANTKALSKAIQKHSQNQSQKQVHDIVGIDKPITYNQEPITGGLWFLKFYHGTYENYKLVFNGQSASEEVFISWKGFIDFIYENKYEELFDCKFINPKDFGKLQENGFQKEKWSSVIKKILSSGVKPEHNLFFRIPQFAEYAEKDKNKKTNNERELTDYEKEIQAKREKAKTRTEG